MTPRILLVEDEENLREAIKMNLELEGYDVEVADTGKKAIKKTIGQRYNLFILDVMLPEVDGFEVCEKIRLTDSDTPILFLTAKDENEDKLKGFKLGADDYLTKPYAYSELLARVEALGRRTVPEEQQTRYSVGDLVLDRLSHRVTRGGEHILLQPREYR